MKLLVIARHGEHGGYDGSLTQVGLVRSWELGLAIRDLAGGSGGGAIVASSNERRTIQTAAEVARALGCQGSQHWSMDDELYRDASDGAIAGYYGRIVSEMRQWETVVLVGHLRMSQALPRRYTSTPRMP